MKVFMISFDRALVGEGGTDAVARHRRYAEQIDKLTIVVVTPPGRYQPLAIGAHLAVYPTNARNIGGHIAAIWGYFFSAYKQEGVDLLVAQDLAAPIAYLLKLFSRTPFIASVHGIWWDRWFSRRRWWHRMYVPVLTSALRRADAVRAVSQSVKKVLQAQGIAREKIYVIPTPVDVQRFEKDKGDAPPAAGVPLALMVGRLEKEKGVDVLLHAWMQVVKAMPAARLLMVGDGTERMRLGKIAIDLKITPSLHFLGVLPPEELPALYHKASIVVLASESESFGKVLVEAGAAGLPCVATATAGASEIILDGETGYLVPVGDAVPLAEKIIALLSDPATATAMGAQAHERCLSHYDGKTVTAQVIKLWRKIAMRARL